MPQENEERNEKEYLALLAIFRRFVDVYGDEESQLAIIEELMALRAEYAIGYACDGFNVTLDEALELLQSSEELSELDENRKKILMAAFENLVDFSVAEEYQMLNELPDIDPEELSEEDIEEFEDVFKKFNKKYAKVENGDIEYALIMAASLAAVRNTTILTYMTQGDERVRPWHRQYEGFSAPKSSFPAWLVPPIEHQCRCFLIEDDVVGEMNVQAAKKPSGLEMPDWFNPTFKESVAFGGRIFSDEHPYFQIDSQHFAKLKDIANKIKQKYLNAKGS